MHYVHAIRSRRRLFYLLYRYSAQPQQCTGAWIHLHSESLQSSPSASFSAPTLVPGSGHISQRKKDPFPRGPDTVDGSEECAG